MVSQLWASMFCLLLQPLRVSSEPPRPHLVLEANGTPVNFTALLKSAHSASPPIPFCQPIRRHVSALCFWHKCGYHADLAVCAVIVLTLSYFGVLEDTLSCGLAVDVVHRVWVYHVVALSGFACLSVVLLFMGRGFREIRKLCHFCVYPELLGKGKEPGELRKRIITVAPVARPGPRAVYLNQG